MGRLLRFNRLIHELAKFQNKPRKIPAKIYPMKIIKSVHDFVRLLLCIKIALRMVVFQPDIVQNRTRMHGTTRSQLTSDIQYEYL